MQTVFKNRNHGGASAFLRRAPSAIVPIQSTNNLVAVNSDQRRAKSWRAPIGPASASSSDLGRATVCSRPVGPVPIGRFFEQLIGR